jgi:hypothetical protein
MSYDLSQISQDVCVRAPRIVLLGVEKIGKSTFAAGSDNPFFLPIKGEEGIDELRVNAPRRKDKTPICCESLADVIGWCQTLREQEHFYQTLVIDSVSALESIIHSGICQEHNTTSINEKPLNFGVGLDKADDAWRKLTAWLDVLRAEKSMASILIGHVKVKRFDDPEGSSYDQYQWDVHDRAAAILYRWADSILFCNTKVVVREENLGFHEDNVRKRGIEINAGSRYLFPQKRPAHPGGGRSVYGRLPYEISLGNSPDPQQCWGHFRDAVAAAMNTT